MPTLVELVSETDTIVFAATPDVSGWVYNNATLDAWYKFPGANVKASKRPNAHGAYGLGQTFSDEAKPIISAQYYGASSLEGALALNRLSSMYADGRSITMRVTDELGTTSREVWLVDAAPKFRHDFTHFPVDIVFVAPDPRRYALMQSASDGMPSSGSGLFWDLGTAPSGLFWDWGTGGSAGQVAIMNTGNAATHPRIEVGGAGGFGAGFRVTEVETGRELTFTRATNIGEVIVLDSRTQRATLGSGDLTAFLSSRDWFSIPAGAVRRYQINPLGSVSGSPTITVYAASAYL